MSLHTTNSFCPTGPGGGVDPSCSVGVKGGKDLARAIAALLTGVETGFRTDLSRPIDASALFVKISREEARAAVPKGKTITEEVVLGPAELKRLRVSQDTLSEDRLKNNVKRDTPAPPIDVIQYKGLLYLDDGNHRAAAAVLKGKSVRANVTRSVREKAVLNVFCPTGSGGGVDPSCSPQSSDKGVPQVSVKQAAEAMGRLWKETKRPRDGGDCGSVARALELSNPTYKPYAVVDSQGAIAHLLVSPDGGKTFLDGRGTRTSAEISKHFRGVGGITYPATYHTDPKSIAGGYYKTVGTSEEFDCGPNATVLKALSQVTHNSFFQVNQRRVTRRPSTRRKQLDPSRTALLRDKAIRELNKRFARIKVAVLKLVAQEDAFGLRQHTANGYVANVFCPTGEGGGVDPTCSPGTGGTGQLTKDQRDEIQSLATKAVSDLQDIAYHPDTSSEHPLAFAHTRIGQYQMGTMVHKESLLEEEARKHPEIREHFEPVRQKLRELVGDTVTLYRGADEKGGVPGKFLSSYAADRKVAEKFLEGYDLQGNKISKVLKEVQVPIEAIHMVIKTPKRPLEFMVQNDMLPKHLSGNVTRSVRENSVLNTFCPTGPGGGVDPSCSKDSGGGRGQLSTTEIDRLYEWREHLWHRETVTKMTMETVKGGRLEHLHPGEIKVYRGRPPGSKPRSAVRGTSWTKSRAVAERWAEGGKVEELQLTKDTPALDIGMALKGRPSKSSHEKEVFVVRGTLNTNISLNSFLQVNQRWAAQSSADQIKLFKEWLGEQFGKELSDEDLWRAYAEEGYRKGMARAYDDAAGATLDKKEPGRYKGSKDQFLKSEFGRPENQDTIELLAGRSFDELEGITSDMSLKMSRALTDGLVKGDAPSAIARDLNKQVDLGAGRAQVVARTEIIRAHAEGQLSSLKSLGVEKVGAAVEWSVVDDDGVCELCEPLDGVVLKIDEARGMLPRHPNCFTSPKIPIYTADGWKPIGRVVVGDLVLTHKGRFRKVTQTHRNQSPNEVVVEFGLEFGGTYHQLAITGDHPVMVNKGWKPARLIRPGNWVRWMSAICLGCGKPLPFGLKYCNQKCQWKNEEHRTNVSQKNSEANLRQYASGERDRKDITAAANARVLEMIADGTFDGAGASWGALRGDRNPSKRPEARQKISASKIGDLNPSRKYPFLGKRLGKQLAEYLKSNPHKHANAVCARNGHRTWIERRMEDALKSAGIAAEYQHTVDGLWIDFAVVEKKVAIECDGEFWHRDKAKEAARDTRLESAGWTVLHFTGKQIKSDIGGCIDKIKRVLKNHNGEYEFCDFPVKWVKKRVAFRPRLYNLSVEEDESYIAKGCVVHNCRCAWIPANVGEDDENQKDTKGEIDDAMEEAGLDTEVDKDRPEEGEAYNQLTVAAFCPTGPGGGIDPTCSPGHALAHRILSKVIGLTDTQVKKIAAANPEGPKDGVLKVPRSITAQQLANIQKVVGKSIKVVPTNLANILKEMPLPTAKKAEVAGSSLSKKYVEKIAQKSLGGYKREAGGGSSWHPPEPDVIPDAARPVLTPKENKAIKDYVGGTGTTNAEHINSLLRKGRSLKGEEKEIEEGLSSAFTKVKEFKSPVTVYRGISVSQDKANKLLEVSKASSQSETEFEMPGYISTSTDLQVAHNFAFNGKKKDVGVVMVIHAKKGLDMSKHSRFDEDELLLNHASKFRVLKVDEGTFKEPRIHLEQMS